MLITTKRLSPKYLCFSLFISGISAITYQVVWQRVFQRFVGTAVNSISIITAISMAGFCLGAWLANAKLLVGVGIGSRRNNDVSQSTDRLLRIYLTSLLLLAALGFLYVFAQNYLFSCFAAIETKSIEFLSLVSIVRLLLTGFVLLVPSTLIGIQLPIVSKYLLLKNHTGSVLAKIYEANLFGSALGAMGASFFLLPNIGISKSITAGAGLYMLAVIVLLLGTIKLGRKGLDELQVSVALGTDSVIKPTATVYPNSYAIPTRLSASIAFFSGAIALTLQIVFIRLFMLVFGSCTYAYGLLLVNQLIALSAGAFLSIKMTELIRSRETSTPLCLVIILLACLLVSFFLYIFLFWLRDLPWLVYAAQFLLRNRLKLPSYEAFIFSRVVVSLFSIFPAFTILGLLFPFTLTHSKRNGKTSAATSSIYCFNAIGATVGCLLGGAVLMPTLARLGTSGIQLSLITIICTLFIFALYLGRQAQIIKLAPAILLAIFVPAVLLVCRPCWDCALLSSGISFLSMPIEHLLSKKDFSRLLTKGSEKDPIELLFYKEGLNSTITVSRMLSDNIIFLKTDGKMEAALPIDCRKSAGKSDKLTHVLLGTLPLLLSQTSPENVLLIGYGTGVTAGCILSSPEVQELDIAEPERSVLQASTFFQNNIKNYKELSSSESNRVHFHAFDGRNLLSMLHKRYQIIISQPGEIWLEGISGLYTLEFWQLAQKRLHSNGIFCQWMPLYAIDRENFVRICLTFRTVFPNTILYHAKNAGEVLLLGFNHQGREKSALTDISRVKNRLQKDALGKELREQNMDNIFELLTMNTFSPLALRKFLEAEDTHQKYNLNVDDLACNSLPTLLARQGMKVDEDLYKNLKPSAASMAELFCSFGTNQQEKSSCVH